MSSQTADATVDFIARIADETGMTRVEVTLHGGEPLIPGPVLLRRLLARLHDRLGADRFRPSIQSNLWRLDDELCGLFREYRVWIGTSLDGPEAITDAQRGPGYFARTMAGIRRAQRQGLRSGCIATFTPRSAPRWREIFEFFLEERLGFSVHPAVPSISADDQRHALPPEDYGHLLCDLADHYIRHRRDIVIPSMDQLCQSLVMGEGQSCTFRDCLGMFLVIDPVGDLYSCQRFCGHAEWRLGRLADLPSLGQLLGSPAARRLADREHRIAERCGDCPHLPCCRGGCPYNAWSGGDGTDRDPYCTAYRALFDHLQTRLTAEMSSPESLDAVAARPWDGRGHPLLRRGPLTELVCGRPHPTQTARAAKRIVAAVELARGPDRPAVATRLVGMGICRTQASGEASLAALWRDICPAVPRLNNLYLHLTWRCQLRCNHCYARADSEGRHQPDVPISDLERLLREARQAGFRQVVLTGGEPLLHRKRPGLLDALTRARGRVSPMRLILRSNLALPLDTETLQQIAQAVDRIVVSLDGDETSHDARRGPGSYAAVVRNLEAYRHSTARLPGAAELSLAATMQSADQAGPPGMAVRDLARRLGIERIRFRPILPLGRAAEWDRPPSPQDLGDHEDPIDLIEAGFQPVAGCGLGQNLYVEPSGEAFPCYAYRGPERYLGNVLATGLEAVIAGTAFSVLMGCAVDADPKCARCDLRYLCGGGCRAWRGEQTPEAIESGLSECEVSKARAERMLQGALAFLAIPMKLVVED